LVVEGGQGFTDRTIIFPGLTAAYQNSLSSFYSTGYFSSPQSDIFQIDLTAKTVTWKKSIEYFMNFVMTDDLKYLFGIYCDDPFFPLSGYLVAYNMADPLNPVKIYNGTADTNNQIYLFYDWFLLSFPDLKINKAKTRLYISADGWGQVYDISALPTITLKANHTNTLCSYICTSWLTFNDDESLLASTDGKVWNLADPLATTSFGDAALFPTSIS